MRFASTLLPTSGVQTMNTTTKDSFTARIILPTHARGQHPELACDETEGGMGVQDERVHAHAVSGENEDSSSVGMDYEHLDGSKK